LDCIENSGVTIRRDEGNCKTLGSKTSICIHSALPQPERIKRYQQFKAFEKRILVATDIFGRGIDVERVNIVVNYDTPTDADSYLHRVGRAGRSGHLGFLPMDLSDHQVWTTGLTIRGRPGR